MSAPLHPCRPAPAMTLLLLSPWLLTFAVFGFFPPAYAVVLSFFRYSPINPTYEFVGLGNFAEVLSARVFWKSLGNSLFYAVGTVPIILFLSMALASILSKPMPMRSTFQAGLFLPAVTSIVVISLIFKFFFSTDGLADRVLQWVGIDPPRPSWLMNPRLALPSLMAMAIWNSIGFYTILFVAAMRSIPDTIYEASRMDGAGPFREFFTITIPMLRPTLAFASFLACVNAIQVFPEVYTMTQGGPMGSTTTLVYWIYELGFYRFQMGTASAATMILCAILMVIVGVQMRLLRSDKGVGE